VSLVVLDFVLLFEHFQLQLVEELIDSLEDIEAFHPHMIGVSPTEVDRSLEAVLTALLGQKDEQIDYILGYEIETRQLLVDILSYLICNFNVNSLDIDVHGTLLSVM
jgi:hypothetical protein